MTEQTPRGAGSPQGESIISSNHQSSAEGDLRTRVAELEADRDRWQAEAQRAGSRRRRSGAVEEPIDRVFDPTAPAPPPTDRGRFAVWLGKITIDTLRVCLGLVFLLFGLLKFFPEVSPAEDISQRTVDALTFGVISGDTAGFLVALVEVTIGFCLVTGTFLKFGLALLAMAMVGIMSPLVLFPEDLFAGKYHAPTLLGQYVLKDFVLLAAGAVIIARELSKELAK